MNRTAVLLLLLLLVLGTTSSSLAAERARDWFKLASPNFELYGNSRESEARHLLRELETFRYVVSRFLGLTNVQRRPALVYLFRDDNSFRPYKPRYNGRPATISGFHSEDPMDYVLALCRQDRDTSTMRVLFHEYTHLLTARQFRDAPVWLHEGVAEVFSTFEGDDDRFNIGVAMTNHAYQLQRQPPLPVANLLAVTRDSRDYNEQARAGPFYASSWLLAHHLLFAKRGFESNVVARYAATCSTTTNQLLAFQSAFGIAPRLLDQSLAAYVRGGTYTVVRQTYPDLEIAKARAVELSPGEIDYALGRLLQMTQQDEEAKERLEAAARRAPKDARPHEALSLLAWRHNDREALRTHTSRALDAHSDNAFLYFLAAETFYQDFQRKRSEAGHSASDEDLDTGRQYCQRAIDLDPWLAPAHHLLGVYVLTQNPRSPALALPHIQRALRCDPGYKPAHLTTASLLAAQGNFGMARQVLANLLAGPLSPELRDTARRIAEDIDTRAASPRRPGAR